MNHCRLTQVGRVAQQSIGVLAALDDAGDGQTYDVGRGQGQHAGLQLAAGDGLIGVQNQWRLFRLRAVVCDQRGKKVHHRAALEFARQVHQVDIDDLVGPCRFDQLWKFRLPIAIEQAIERVEDLELLLVYLHGAAPHSRIG